MIGSVELNISKPHLLEDYQKQNISIFRNDVSKNVGWYYIIPMPSGQATKPY